MNLQNIKVVKMELRNFKLNELIEINFNPYLTEILGSNGVGKSTIMDAFSFVFLGTNRFGVSSFDAINSNHKYCSVKIYFKENLLGDMNVIERTQQITNSNTKENNVYINNKGISTQKFKKMIDKDLFLSIINPMYFDTLSPSKGKDILLGITEIYNDDVLYEISKEEDEFIKENVDKYKDLLTNIDSNIAKKEKSKNNKEIKACELEIENLNTLIDYNINVLKGIENDMFNNMNSRSLYIEEELKEYFDKISSLDDKSKKEDFLDISEVVSQKKSLNYLSIKRDNLIDTIKEYKNSVIINTKRIKELKTINKLYDLYVNYELFLISQTVNANLKNSKIIIKDDNDKFVFHKIYNNEKTEVISTSENIKFGLDFSNMLMDLTDYDLPIFIDNAESIVSLSNDNFSIDRQIISLAVERNLDLSIVENDLVKNLNTLETLPRKDINDVFIYRLFNDDCVENIF